MKIERRRVGRPPIDPDDESVKLSLTIPAKRYDELCSDARRHRMTLPDLVRRLLTRRANKDS
jgi:hypothetical protein